MRNSTLKIRHQFVPQRGLTADKILSTCIALQCLAVYRFISFGGINLSLDRLLSVVAFIIACFRVVSMSGRDKRNDTNLFIGISGILIIFVLISLLNSTAELKFVVSRYLSYLQAITYIIITYALVAYNRTGLFLFNSAMIFTLIIAVICSLYSMYMIFVVAQPIYTLPFLSLDAMYEQDYYLSLLGSETRLFYPYSIPQELSMVTGFWLYMVLRAT